MLSNFERINSPTSSKTSAPAELPIVTSKDSAVDFFTQGVLLLNSSDFRQCFMVCTLSSLMWTCRGANEGGVGVSHPQ